MLNSQLLAGFVETFLRVKFDNPHPIPRCHFEWWDMCCSEDRYVAIAAPRGHAKSTAISLALALASMLFRFRRHCMIVSSSETMAMNFLKDILAELVENEELREGFQLARMVKETEGEIIAEFTDGERFRMIAKGAEQRIRGTKWRNTRPDLIIVDDLEEDEQVENLERRQKLWNWFFKALLPCGGDKCIVRVVGTILHDDSLLNRLLADPMWTSKRYRAHAGIDNFTNILWPEKFPPQRLMELQSMYRKNLSAYSQEYLNEPVADGEQYFQPGWLRPMQPEHRRLPLQYFCAADLAIGKDANHDYSVFMTVGVAEDGRMFVVDVVRGRFDSFELAEQVFQHYSAWQPYMLGLEGGHIEKAIMPLIRAEMTRRRKYPNVVTVSHGNKDKLARAKPIQGALRAGYLLFDTEASWWPGLQDELVRFPRGAHDDQVDALSIVGALIELSATPQTPAEDSDPEFDALQSDPMTIGAGRSEICGY